MADVLPCTKDKNPSFDSRPRLPKLELFTFDGNIENFTTFYETFCSLVHNHTAFHFNILQNFLPVFCKNERIFREKLTALADGDPVSLFPIVALAALDNVTDGQRIDDEKVREEVDTFMFEGHDTTSSGISFCLYNISNHEDVQRKLEIMQMKYLDLVIKESLRLHPAVPFIERKITHDAGQKFAMLEMKVMISGVVRCLKLMPAAREPVLLSDLILRSKDGIYVKLKTRNRTTDSRPLNN
ncbi:Cytochrome P450 4V2 [Operophtera brumata]|uniref:Cytochrome P450 4V2 n=1 Tax=Operophtera brumata TaxID=104452 RepID=A0A0L7KPB7_OPEBR|nr:Cytochrome P450 4V2 [Operophtera brumata]